MPRLLISAILGAVLAMSTSLLGQPKPPGGSAPKVNDEKPATTGKGPGSENAHAMCLGCHGIPGYRTAFPDVYHVPLIGGQQPGYITNALKAYASGERSHPSMRGIAKGLSEDVIKILAEQYGEADRPKEAAVSVRAAAQARRPSEAGKAKAAQLCVACHGADGNKPSDPGQPILAGQYYDFLVRAITDYKIGRRINPVMKGFAAQLSKQDVEDLAAWFASQPSNLHVLPR